MPKTTIAPLVLVADDSAELREIYAEALRDAGLRVELATDGVDAVEKALALLPDVIVIDLEMPRLDGLAAARRLKQDPRTSGVPVILSTSLPVKDEAELAGCAFLEKPCRLDALVAAVRAQLPP